MWTRWGLLLALSAAVIGLVALPSAAGLAPDTQQGAYALDTTTQDTNVDCGACHDDATKQSFPNSDVCTSCHVLLGRTYQDSIHSEKTETYANFDCTQCHSEPEDGWFMHFRVGPHGAQNPGISMAPEDTCASTGCHDSHNPRGAIYAEWNETADEDWEQGMQSHSAEAPGVAQREECSPCHGTHQGTFANLEDAPAVNQFALDDQPEPSDVEEWRITCAACHNPHNVTTEDNLRGSFESESRFCAQCHTEPDIASGKEYEAHPSLWELYSGSKFATEDGVHPKLECSSCHMGRQADTDEYNAITGHSFDVDVSLLGDVERVKAPPSETCGNCHGDLMATIDGSKSSISGHLNTATRLRKQANESLAESSIQDKEELESRLADGSAWLDLVPGASVGIHSPDRTIKELRRSIDTFESVRATALEGDTSDEGEPSDTTQTTTSTTKATETTPPTTETETPGIGPVGSLVALVLASVLALRIRNF